MKLTLKLLAFSSCLVTIQCGLQTIVANPGGIGGIFKGPDSETIVKGPDGSVITSEQKGGIIETEEKLEPIIVAESQIDETYPVLPSSFIEDGYIAPLVSTKNEINNIVPVVNSPKNYVSPGLITSVDQDVRETIPLYLGHEVNVIEPEPHIIETEIIDAPTIESKESSDLVGPSGRISTRGSESIVSGPASTTITKTAKVLVSPPVITGKVGVPHQIAPVQVPTFIEVNNEIPVVSKSPNIYPFKAGDLFRPTIAPSIATGTPIVYPLNTETLSSPTPTPPVASTPFPIVIQQTAQHRPNQLPLLPQSRPILATGLLTGEQFVGRHQISTTINPLHDQSIIPNVSPKVSIEDEGASGFIQPGAIYSTLSTSSESYEGIPSSTVSPIFSSTSSFYEGSPSTTISPIASYDTQYILNPSDIPSRNIIPPEISIPREGTTITSITKSQGASTSPGIIHLQGIDNDNIQRTEYVSDNDHNLKNGYYRTNVLLGTDPNSVYHQQRTAVFNDHLLTETNPILYQNGIKQLTYDYNPISSETELNSNFYDKSIEHDVSDRYGRKRRNEKY